MAILKWESFCFIILQWYLHPDLHTYLKFSFCGSGTSVAMQLIYSMRPLCECRLLPNVRETDKSLLTLHVHLLIIETPSLSQRNVPPMVKTAFCL